VWDDCLEDGAQGLADGGSGAWWQTHGRARACRGPVTREEEEMEARSVKRDQGGEEKGQEEKRIK